MVVASVSTSSSSSSPGHSQEVTAVVDVGRFDLDPFEAGGPELLSIVAFDERFDVRATLNSRSAVLHSGPQFKSCGVSKGMVIAISNPPPRNRGWPAWSDGRAGLVQCCLGHR
jgi:hypothetical protein